jgi:hypothetical protein
MEVKHMSTANRPLAYRVSESPESEGEFDGEHAGTTQTIELREEQRVAHTNTRDLSEIENTGLVASSIPTGEPAGDAEPTNSDSSEPNEPATGFLWSLVQKALQ